MSWLDFSTYPLWINITIFAIAAGVVWVAGSRLAAYADNIAELTGLGHALIGMLLLGGVTSLPEIAVTVSAGISGNAPLAVNNLFGGVALQVVIIAIGDAALRGRALTYVIATPAVLLQGTFCCAILCMLIGAIAVGDVAIWGVGAWSTGVFFSAIILLWLVTRYKDDQAWVPAGPLDIGKKEEEPERAPHSLVRALQLTAVAALVIVIAGYLLSQTGEALAEQTGLGSSFMGAVFVGLATSLPEISTVLAAVRRKRYVMAFSDIFGTNIIDLALIFIIDLSYSGPPVLNEVSNFSIFAAALATLLTLIYMAGLIERKDRQRLGLGVDSWLVILTYGGGVTLLYTLRGG